MPLLRRLERNSTFGDPSRRRPTVIALILAMCLTLAAVACPPGYAFATPQPQDEAPPSPPPAPKKQTKTPANPALARADSFPASKADQKKAKEAYNRGLKSE